MNRTTIINSLIAKIGAKSYLEIGCNEPENFNKICCANRVGVDPLVSKQKIEGQHTFVQKTSDEFFKYSNESFDVIFIDGLHTEEQVTKDITNAMKQLSSNGVIVCHDMNPLYEDRQTPEYNGGYWNGTGWKAFVKLRSFHHNWNFTVVDADEGCGIIWRGTDNNFMNRLEVNWDNFQKNRVGWLNLISVQDFCNDFLQNDRLAVLLNAYLGDPNYAENNFSIAMYYDEIGQKASAVSFYIRAAERSTNSLLQYESLIRAAMCFMAQGTRGLSVRGLLQRAMALLPKRPEAYFLLSRWWERENSIEGWVNSYTLASMGLDIADFNGPTLRTWIEYPGKYGLLFEKAVAGWWVGQCEESRSIMLDLLKNYQLDEGHRQSILNNLRFMEGLTGKKLIPIA